MARPQSPDLRPTGTTGPVPEANSPGHHPEHDQDRPDLDAFAERFSGRPLDDLPSDTGVLDDHYGAADDQRSTGRSLTRWAAPVAGIAAVAVLIAVVVRRRRR